MNSITLPANAKLNLFLDIAGKRDDGYHDIITEMQEIDLCDTVTVKLTKSGIRVTCDNPAIPTDRRNIAYRAAELFMRESNLDDGSWGVKIHIKKRIPVMAGLGGSSTDGAAVLKALHSLWLMDDGVFGSCDLLKMGAKLGADVPFCLVGGRAECRGIGDIITPLPDLEPQFYAIIQPDFCCNTKKAYELYSQRRGDLQGDERNVFMELYNDERINNACSELLQAGAQSASMTGSGSAVFGVFRDRKSAEAALKKLDYPFKQVACNIRRSGV